MAAKPKLPAPQPTVRMPDSNDQTAIDAKKRAQSALLSSKGRESTDLTGINGDASTSFLGR